MTFRLRHLVLAAALCLAPVAVHAGTDPAAATAPAAAKVAIVEQIYTNLGVLDILSQTIVKSATTGDDAENLSDAERAKIGSLIEDGLAAHKAGLVHKLALANADSCTVDQLNVILKMSKIRYLHDLIAEGAEVGPPADAGSMTADEATFFNAHSNDVYIGTFLEKVGNIAPIQPDIDTIIGDAARQFVTWDATQRKSS